jgi:hypothetical protein
MNNPTASLSKKTDTGKTAIPSDNTSRADDAAREAASPGISPDTAPNTGLSDTGSQTSGGTVLPLATPDSTKAQ